MRHREGESGEKSADFGRIGGGGKKRRESKMAAMRRNHLSWEMPPGVGKQTSAARDRSIRVIEGGMMERCNTRGLPVVIATFICEPFRARYSIISRHDRNPLSARPYPVGVCTTFGICPLRVY